MLGLPLPLRFLSLLLLFCVFSSKIFMINSLVIVGLSACRPSQIRAIMEFKSEFDSRGCNQSNYVNGVECNNITGAVTKLQVPSGCLSGTLKPNSSLFKLHHLRYLDLAYNDFSSSSLPSGFGNLNKLKVLSLSSNGFVGQIPSSFSNLSMLSSLDLSHNELTGNFPLLWNLSKLHQLDLSSNHLSGTLNPGNSLFGLHPLRYLNLAYNNFTSSSIPSEFGNLNRLEVLSLSSNGFQGQLPPSFSNLSRLTELYLYQNELTGSIQLVQNLTKLSFLNLAHNHFFGTIPSSLFAMPFLSYLFLMENHLTGPIEIPNSSSSSRLEVMFLGGNQFEGNIVEPVSKLISLKYLDLSFQNTSYPIDLNFSSSLKSLKALVLSGNSISPASLSSDSGIPLSLQSFFLSGCNVSEFPNILKSLQNLTDIDLTDNRIKGKVPEWLWKLPFLSSVALSYNSLNGFEGSVEVLVNSSVRRLELHFNSFEGALPNLPLSIIHMSTRHNRFTGNIPLSICNRSSLKHLDLSYNSFTGSIPQCFSNLTSLLLRKNNLEGSLPDMFSAGASLRTLDVGYNRLTGKLPRSLLNCSTLRVLTVDHNRIEAAFPFWLKALPNLQVLILRSNKFHGPVSPPDHGPLAFPELRVFELSDNNFTGSLSPSYFMNWKASILQMNGDGSMYMGDREKMGSDNLSYFIISYDDIIDLQYKGLSMKESKVFTFYSAIDFSGNRIEGQIPESIGLLKALVALNLSNNAFTGHIPLSLGNLTELESLDLSSNQLSGTIPNGLGGLSFLEYMNVSHNQLKGEIPQGTQITGQPKSSFEGNAGLCGLPLEESCSGTNSPPAQQLKEEKEEVLNWKAVAIGYAPGVLLGLSIAQLIASYKPEWLVKIIGQNKRRIR